MTEFFCIYGGEMRPTREKTKEHIIPVALGGSNSFVTHDVSKPWHDKVGSEIDKPFVDMFMNRIRRNQLKLASRKGNIPDIIITGVMEIEGSLTEVSYIVDQSGNANYDMDPIVERSADGLNWFIRGTPERLKRVIPGVIKRLQEDGFDVSEEELMKLAENKIVEQPRIHAEVKVDVLDLLRGPLRIALGTGHYVLGYEWSKSKEADLYREYLWKEERQEALRDIQSIVGITFEGAARNKDVGSHCHVITVMNTKKLILSTLFFGEYEFMVQLSPYSKEYTNLERGDGRVLVVDTSTRELQEFTPEQFLKAKEEGKFRGQEG